MTSPMIESRFASSRLIASCHSERAFKALSGISSSLRLLAVLGSLLSLIYGLS